MHLHVPRNAEDFNFHNITVAPCPQCTWTIGHHTSYRLCMGIVKNCLKGPPGFPLCTDMTQPSIAGPGRAGWAALLGQTHTFTSGWSGDTGQCNQWLAPPSTSTGQVTLVMITTLIITCTCRSLYTVHEPDLTAAR